MRASSDRSLRTTAEHATVLNCSPFEAATSACSSQARANTGSMEKSVMSGLNSPLSS